MTDEQCTCGIVFASPMTSDPDFLEHCTNGTHKAALLVEVCGPCFMGFCKGCDGIRRSDVQRWRCRCMHDYPLTFNLTTDPNGLTSTDQMRRIWSDWLENGRNSSVSTGMEEAVNDGNKWNPIKEI